MRNDQGEKVHTVQRTRGVQSGHCWVRHLSALTHNNHHQQFQDTIGTWNLAWLQGRLGARSIAEAQQILGRMPFHDWEGTFSIVDLLDAFPHQIRAGLFMLYYLMGAGEEYVRYRAALYSESFDVETGELTKVGGGVVNMLVFGGQKMICHVQS